MSWRRKLQWSVEKGKASFRGATFYVDNTDTGVGRRTEMHVYPNKPLLSLKRDFVWAKDLGPEADEFIVNGYVVQSIGNGLNHFTERDKLIRALKTKGPGQLIHPFYGTMRVSLMGKARIRESLSEGQGIAQFTMVFAQYREPIFNQQILDFTALVDLSALNVINSALDSFTDLMDTAGSFLYTLTGPIVQTMNNMQDAINSVSNAVASTISAAVGVVNTAISLVDSVLSAPCDLANQILNAGDAILGLVGMAGDVVQGGIVGGCSGIERGDTTTLDGTTIPEPLGVSAAENLATEADYNSSNIDSVPVEQANNIEFAVSMAQASMLANAAKIGIRIEFTSHEQMISTTELIADSMDNLIDRLGAVSDELSGTTDDTTEYTETTQYNDPNLYDAVVELRGTFVENMLRKNVGLAKQYDYTIGLNENALGLAYDKYNDLNRYSDIYDRNRVAIKHPGFLPGGETIKLLNE